MLTRWAEVPAGFAKHGVGLDNVWLHLLDEILTTIVKFETIERIVDGFAAHQYFGD